jgi:hypothetical protein
MPVPEYIVINAEGRSDLVEKNSAVTREEWPEFMLNDPVADKFWVSLYRKFPHYQFILADPQSEEILASCNSIPLAWEGDFKELPDEGWDWALKKAFDDLATGEKPTIQCALSVTIPKKYRRQGLSAHAIRAMKDIGKKNGLKALIAPVRPSMKSRYPMTPMKSYIRWRNSQGVPKDPWMGVHAKEGAEIVKICPRSMRITATIDKWEEWTDMQFPGSDSYVVPGALVPVKINWDHNEGIYVEPNVWMVHHL